MLYMLYVLYDSGGKGGMGLWVSMGITCMVYIDGMGCM